MRLFVYGLGFTLALGTGLALGGGCAAATNPLATSAGAGGSGTGGASSGTGLGGMGTGAFTASSTTGSSTSGTVLDAGLDGLASCASFHAQATQDPAAMLIVLQGSASMSTNGKWQAAQQAIIQAIDQDIFDTMSLGLTSFPKGPQSPPPCAAMLVPQVYCTYYAGTTSDPLPVPIAPAGMNKSNASSGVRHDILNWLNSHAPLVQDSSNSSPIYDAMNAGYHVLQATNIAKRILVLITDGGFDCTSVSGDQARISAAMSDGFCPDWESPNEVNALITAARTNAAAPVDTFIVGVPGSNTSPGEFQGLWQAAPYWMELALSTYAVSGSPTTVDPNCDMGAMWSQNGTPPANPCHIDLSGNNFNAQALADAIATIRGKALGCVYDLPAPPMGQTIDPSQVNVVETINNVEYLIPKRTNPSDMCLGNNPCWDYDMSGKVVLIGSACSAVQGSATAKVDIYVGCATVTK